MTDPMHRRRFLGAAAATGLAAATGRARAGSPGPNDTIVVGVVGTGGRGRSLAGSFAAEAGVEVAYVCDVDRRRAGQAADEVAKAGKRTPEAVEDLRRILEDGSVDAVVIATCNHWHSPATILSCKAEKHVYVEKPCSHTPREGELMVEAAREHSRVVQLGTQRRSWPQVAEAVHRVRNGAIGRAYYAHSYYNANRPSIGRGKETAPPEGLNYDLWQGPAPRQAFRDNILHYNWHWFWHWGNGELGNNGIHMLDVCRWGLGVEFPAHVSSTGGRYRFDDDQQTPDTHIVGFDFPGEKSIVWEGLSCNGHRPGGGDRAEVIFYGDEGSLAITNGTYAIFDLNGKTIETAEGSGGDEVHIKNFLAAIRGDGALNAPISEGHRSTLLCHLGNIAHRTGRALKCDPKDGRILGDDEAMGYWTREYAPGWWEPKV